MGRLRAIGMGVALGFLVLASACIAGVAPREDNADAGMSATPASPTPVPTLAAFPGVPDGFTFNRDLEEGMAGEDVRYLQTILNSDQDTAVAESGPGSPGRETELFDASTREAVIRFQEEYAEEILSPAGLVKGTGIVGQLTRAKLNDMLQGPQPLVISVMDGSPRVTRGCESGVDQWRGYTTPKGHPYIWGYAGGSEGGPSRADCWVQFQAVIPRAGTYDVYAWFYADPQNSSRVPFTVSDESGVVGSIQVDQSATEYFTWREVMLGAWEFESGETVRVRVTDATGEPYDGQTTINVDTLVFAPEGRQVSSVQYLLDKSRHVSARIDRHSPVEPVEVLVKKKAGLDFAFTNTGSRAWTFHAAASLRKPDGAKIHLPLRTVSLEPGEQGEASWTYVIDQEGAWDLVFGLWREEEQVIPLGTTGWLEGFIVGEPPE